MNKKSIIVLLVLVLALSGLFAKDSGIKVGGQLGWGFDIVKIKIEKDETQITKMKNNGFAFNLTGEYDFDENWGVKANLGMMFAGKTSYNYIPKGKDQPETSTKKSGLYIDFAVDAKYTYAINEKVSLAGLAGLELVSGYITKDGDSVFYNVAFGLNLGLEGSYKITNKISVVGGATGSWLFVNSAEAIKSAYEEAATAGTYKVIVTNFYIRPYVGATYSF